MVDEVESRDREDGDKTVEENKEDRESMDVLHVQCTPSTSSSLNEEPKSTQMKEESNEDKMKRMNALLNRKRKKAPESAASCSSVPSIGKEEDEGTKRRREEARQKILWETERAKERAERMGPQGWVRPKSLNTNKEFLSRTIQSTLSRMQKREREDK